SPKRSTWSRCSLGAGPSGALPNSPSSRASIRGHWTTSSSTQRKRPRPLPLAKEKPNENCRATSLAADRSDTCLRDWRTDVGVVRTCGWIFNAVGAAASADPRLDPRAGGQDHGGDRDHHHRALARLRRHEWRISATDPDRIRPFYRLCRFKLLSFLL